MKALVTGGAGFIGSHLSDALIRGGHEVAVLDNLTTGTRDNVAAAVSFHERDLRDRDGVFRVFEAEAPDVVFHLAAQADVRRSMSEPEFDAAVNIQGSLNLLEGAVKYSTGRLIFASTGGAVYGEPDSLPVTEAHPRRPLSNYGVAKAAVELYLRVYAETHGLKTAALRYANVYGPRQNPKGEAGVVAIFSMLMLGGKQPTIFGDGTKTRDYVYVDDVVAANLAALERGAAGVYNVGTGVLTTDSGVYEAVRDALGASIEAVYGDRRPGEVEHICLDHGHARSELGWQPKVSFVDGVERAVAWYKDFHSRQT